MSADKEYTNGEVTILWKPDLCVHSTRCWHGLPEVCRPREKPWINPLAAGSRHIIDQVSECPSRALSYYLNEKPND